MEQEEDEKEVEEHKEQGEEERFLCSSTVSVFRMSEAAERRSKTPGFYFSAGVRGLFLLGGRAL